MKGIVFTEFLEMVESKFNYNLVDEILNETDLPSGGIYTAIGTYDHSEIIKLVSKLSEKTNIPVEDLVYSFGVHLFDVFSKGYTQFFAKATNAFEFLYSIENYIHTEVKKLYPDAELPSFQITKTTDTHLVMIYSSERKMAKLAHGLIDGCLNYYGEKAEVSLNALNSDGSKVQFDIKK